MLQQADRKECLIFANSHFKLTAIFLCIVSWIFPEEVVFQYQIN